MAASIIWSPQAESSFDAIIDDLLERWSEKVVMNFVQQVFKSIDQIALFPKSNPVFKQYPDIRRCVINKHVSLFYRLRVDTVELITFFENRRGFESLILES